MNSDHIRIGVRIGYQPESDSDSERNPSAIHNHNIIANAQFIGNVKGAKPP